VKPLTDAALSFGVLLEPAGIIFLGE